MGAFCVASMTERNTLEISSGVKLNIADLSSKRKTSGGQTDQIS